MNTSIRIWTVNALSNPELDEEHNKMIYAPEGQDVTCWRGEFGDLKFQVLGINGRYGVATNGNAVWTDAKDAEDAVKRVLVTGEVIS